MPSFNIIFLIIIIHIILFFLMKISILIYIGTFSKSIYTVNAVNRFQDFFQEMNNYDSHI